MAASTTATFTQIVWRDTRGLEPSPKYTPRHAACGVASKGPVGSSERLPGNSQCNLVPKKLGSKGCTSCSLVSRTSTPLRVSLVADLEGQDLIGVRVFRERLRLGGAHDFEIRLRAANLNELVVRDATAAGRQTKSCIGQVSASERMRKVKCSNPVGKLTRQHRTFTQSSSPAKRPPQDARAVVEGEEMAEEKKGDTGLCWQWLGWFECARSGTRAGSFISGASRSMDIAGRPKAPMPRITLSSTTQPPSAMSTKSTLLSGEPLTMAKPLTTAAWTAVGSAVPLLMMMR